MTPMGIAECLKTVWDMEAEHATLESRLTQLLKSDPETISRLQNQVDAAKLEANMWTDNIFILRQFVCNKMGVAECVVNDAFGIPKDIDLID